MIRRPPRATRTDTLFPTRRSAVLGEAALARAVEAVRGRGGIVLLVAHRRSILSSVGHVLHLAGGRMKAFGPREKLLSEMAAVGSRYYAEFTSSVPCPAMIDPSHTARSKERPVGTELQRTDTTLTTPEQK